MAEFTDSQITSLAQFAETEIAKETKGIVERFSYPVTAGQSEITLSENILDIMRVFWKGKRLHGSRSIGDLVRSGSTPTSSVQGEPLEYVSTFVGIPLIKIYPAPNKTLAAGTGDLWTPNNIENCLIIEACVSPTFTSSTIRVPAFVRRQYVKDYVMYRLLKKEGKMLDLKSSNYFKAKFDQDLVELRYVREQLFSCIPKQFQPIVGKGFKVARPVLPPQFGTICE